jgi:hypothetical protein
MKRAAFLLIGFAMAASTAGAAEVRLRLSGTAYAGGPTFDLAFGRTIVGSGVVDAGKDSDGGSTFDFDVSDLLLVGRPDLRIRLTNDARGGPGEDRNLYLLSATVNGLDLPIADFRVLMQGEPRLHRLRRGHLEIWSGNEVAVASAPPEGWPLGPPELRPALVATDAGQGR